jgi:hypothetical protein
MMASDRVEFDKARPTLASGSPPVLIYDSYVPADAAKRMLRLLPSYGHGIATRLFSNKVFDFLARSGFVAPANACPRVRSVCFGIGITCDLGHGGSAPERGNSRQGGETALSLILHNVGGSDLTFGDDRRSRRRVTPRPGMALLYRTDELVQMDAGAGIAALTFELYSGESPPPPSAAQTPSIVVRKMADSLQRSLDDTDAEWALPHNLCMPFSASRFTLRTERFRHGQSVIPSDTCHPRVVLALTNESFEPVKCQFVVLRSLYDPNAAATPWSAIAPGETIAAIDDIFPLVCPDSKCAVYFELYCGSGNARVTAHTASCPSVDGYLTMFSRSRVWIVPTEPDPCGIESPARYPEYFPGPAETLEMPRISIRSARKRTSSTLSIQRCWRSRRRRRTEAVSVIEDAYLSARYDPDRRMCRTMLRAIAERWATLDGSFRFGIACS